MKLILDFDDVVFNNTKQFKPRIFFYLEQEGIMKEKAFALYETMRKNQFSLKKFLAIFEKQELYEEIMRECQNFLNLEVIELIKKIGKENCLLVSNGDEEFQKDKIKRSQIENLFEKIYIVPASKKEVIEKICAQYPDEKIIFLDDKEKFLQDLDTIKFSNLTTILFDETSLQKLKLELK